MVTKIDSNVTGLAFAEETTPKVLPGSPTWYALEPNSYNEFGGEISSVARAPINVSRQRKRGTTTDLDVSGGFNHDITQNNLTRLFQGFMFANYHEKADTASFGSAAVVITAVDGTNDQYEAASGLDVFRAGDIILASGFTTAANNGIKVLDSVAAGAIDTVEDLTTEASPPAAARVQAVGFQFASGDATMTVASGVATLGATSKNLTQLGFQVGEWVFIGGDSSGLKFATCPVGYARVKSVSTTAIVFDKVTAAFVTDTGTGKTLQIFFGKFLRNESVAASIITRTYNIERQLGNDGSGVQSEYLEGAVANELTINIPQTDKLNADLSFVALNNAFQTGATGIKSGTRVAALGESPFNTSSNVYRAKMNIIDAATLQPTALFAYVTEANISIKNNASLSKAVGVVGGFGVTVGDFEVGGNIEAYFADTTAVSAVRNNSDVTFDIILAKSNAGMVYDIPMMGLGGGRLNVEKDAAIKLPLETLAAEGTTGYTLGINVFPYLPTAAMPA